MAPFSLQEAGAAASAFQFEVELSVLGEKQPQGSCVCSGISQREVSTGRPPAGVLGGLAVPQRWPRWRPDGAGAGSAAWGGV